MRKSLAVVGSVLYLPIAPGTVSGLVPWYITKWTFQPAFFGQPALRAVGVGLIGLGLIPLVESFARFALKGLGTPSPVFQPRNLVVSGFYRHVRNPIYVGLVAIVLGQALLFGDSRLLIYAALLWLSLHLYVVLVEEPSVTKRFGEEYTTFRKHVPRWIPRMRPWKG